MTDFGRTDDVAATRKTLSREAPRVGPTLMIVRRTRTVLAKCRQTNKG